MARFVRTSTIDAPFEDVWAFHSRIDGLQALTPRWMGLRVESVAYPDDAASDVLVPGTEIHVAVRPFGVFPGGRWVSRITDRERDQAAMFRDAMISGPFDRWIHTHRFADTAFGTVVRDEIDYALPGPTPDAAARPALVPLFAYRHRRTAALLS